MSRADLARATGKTPQAITRAMNGGRDGGGQVPGIWTDILSALGLELTTHPEGSEAELLAAGADDLAATLADLEAETPAEELDAWHRAFEASA